MSLARCDRITDAAVGELCDTFALLERVDLTRCVEVGDAAMTRLAAFTRQLGGGSCAAGGSSDEEVDEEEWEAQAAVEAVGGMQLAGDASPPAAAGVAGSKVLESPDSAVRRIAAQRHADMMARSAQAGALPRCCACMVVSCGMACIVAAATQQHEGFQQCALTMCSATHASSLCVCAARKQHGQPRDLGLRELVLKETSVSARGTKLLLQPGSATSKSLRVRWGRSLRVRWRRLGGWLG